PQIESKSSHPGGRGTQIESSERKNPNENAGSLRENEQVLNLSTSPVSGAKAGTQFEALGGKGGNVATLQRSLKDVSNVATLRARATQIESQTQIEAPQIESRSRPGERGTQIESLRARAEFIAELKKRTEV